MKTLPLGEQNFNRIWEDNLLYVDKTQQIAKLINYSSYVFLSRPRRFGKSLLISTIEALFQARKEQFKGLWIEKNWEWETYPILRMDFSKLEYSKDVEIFEEDLIRLIHQCGLEYGVKTTARGIKGQLSELLFGIHQKTGKRTVILIDEYDKPITNHLTEIAIAYRNQNLLKRLYETLKAESEYIHFLFLTGISKFAKMSVFSVINNLKDVSLLPEFHNIVGFTKEEILNYFNDYLQAFSQKENVSLEELMHKIQTWYNGYSWDGEHKLYNPYAILNVLADGEFNNYWFETGTPQFLVNLIKHKYALDYDQAPVISEFENIQATKSTFNSYDLENINLTALLFQTGYLTIKSKATENQQSAYILGYPNLEVKTALNAYLLKSFTEIDLSSQIEAKALFLLKSLKKGDQKQFLDIITSIFSGIPYQLLKKANEYYYQSLFYQLLALLGIEDIMLEVAGSIGRADGVLLLDNKVFIFEFKFARKGTMNRLLKSGEKQIMERGYLNAWKGSSKKIIRVVVGFLYKKSPKSESAVLTIDTLWKEIS